MEPRIEMVELEFGRLIGPVRKLIARHRRSRDKTQPGGRIQIVGQISESLSLLSCVVNRIGRRDCGTESQVGLEIQAGEVITEIAVASAKLETRLHGVTLSAQNCELVLPAVASVLGMNVDHAGGAVAV